MKRRTLLWAVVAASLLLVEGCSSAGGYRGSGPRVGVGFGFYHHGYSGWGSGYYRGYDRGVSDAVGTMDVIDTIDAGDMGMPDIDMGPAMDFDF